MSRGTPQGSSLSGLLWNMYVADIPHQLQQSKCIKYSDDLCVYTSSNNIEDIEKKLQLDLNSIQLWCDENGMTINSSKTKSIIFYNNKPKEESKLNLTINSENIENVTIIKYLGLFIDSKLSFSYHFDKVCKDMTSKLYLINRQKHTFSNIYLKIFSTSLIISKLDYCFIVWGNLSITQYTRLDRIMYRAAKLVIFKNRNLSMFECFEKVNWLGSEERYHVYTLEYVYKNCVLNSPLNKCFNFTKNLQTSENRVTRASFDFVKPRMKIKFGQKSFSFNASKIWNDLPLEIKQLNNFNQFSFTLRQYVIKNRKNDFIYY
jgi:hypothetical protein